MKVSHTSASSKALLNLSGITKAFGTKTLLEGIDLSISRGDKVVLVGENGIGKSTLLKIILGSVEADQGSIGKSERVGYLPQDSAGHASVSVREHLVNACGDATIQTLLASRPDLASKQFASDFNRMGGHRFGKLLSQLGLKDLPLDRPFAQLSGGQKTKVALVGLAVMEPDLLLLDEPTNHLDHEALRWLESFIRGYAGATLMVTHDRSLINNSANVIAELSPDTRRLASFRGGYRDYLTEKDRIHERQTQLLAYQQGELKNLRTQLRSQHAGAQHFSGRRDNDKIGYNSRGAGKQRSQKRRTNQINTKVASLEDNLAVIPAARKGMVLSWDHAAQPGGLSASGLCAGYPGRLLFNDLSLAVGPRDRLVLVGPNGCGKTTLLKILAGVREAQEGLVSLGEGTKVGYLDQEQEYLHRDTNAVENLRRLFDLQHSRDELCHHLKLVGFTDDLELTQPVAQLSTGKQRKLQLAGIILSGANLLLLDEPTNHIDLLSIEAIESQLLEFPGAVVAASHDRWFVEKVGTQLLELNAP